ncbi:aldo/keto reductase [Agaribacter flavus]|uniref:Aldo/keto reductase n=1 Tax=Agaribacter flavus TaxID=1902781 RepID=A0ABV7FPB4_9ALTE
MEYRQLGKTSLKLSRVGYGASPLGGVFRNISEEDGIKTVHRALELGINYIDVSPYYGATLAEKVLGKALRGVAREKYVLSTKAGRYGPDFADFDFSADRIKSSLEESCNRLGVDNVDILFLHDVEFASMQQIFDEALPCLNALKQDGIVKYIGVTGYPLKIFSDTVAAFDIDCVLSYCRYGLHDTSLQGILPTLKKAGVGVINASPTGMGLLTKRGAPSWHPASPSLQDASKQAVALCLEHGVDPTEISLQFAMDHEDISSTLVGTASPVNIEKNVAWAKKQMNSSLAHELRSLFADLTCTWPSGYPENQD